MRFRPPSVRARLTLWHAGVLTLIVCIFSAGILLFVKARLYAGLDAQLDREITTIGKIYREEPEELKDLASHWGITLFQVDKTGGIRQQTEAWEREGLSRALQPDDDQYDVADYDHDDSAVVFLDLVRRIRLTRKKSDDQGPHGCEGCSARRG